MVTQRVMGRLAGLVCVAAVLTVPGSMAGWLSGGQSETEQEDGAWLHTSRQSDCPSLQATCRCGHGDQDTIIVVPQCPFSTSWGSMCEPCVTVRDMCKRLQNCTSCSARNPDAICAECHPDRYGLHCQKERPCKSPNMTDSHLTVHRHSTRKGRYRLEFRCTGGRARHGPRIIRCQPDGTWNKEPPKCVLPLLCTSPPTPLPPFTRLKPTRDGYTSERAVYQCDAGYVTKSRVLETSLLCENGAWVQVGDSVVCEPSPKCGGLPQYVGARVTAGSPIKSVYEGGESADYECESGFEPDLDTGGQANFTVVCVDGLWSGQLPRCVLKGCPRLTVDHAASIIYTAANHSTDVIDHDINDVTPYVTLNSVARVTCHNDYTVEDGAEVTCSSSGQWLPAAPKCVSKVCEYQRRGHKCWINTTSPDVIPDVNGTHIFPGQVVTYRCREGTYRRLHQGDTERVCIFNGTLTGSEIVCEPSPVCTIETNGDPHIKFCRGLNCNITWQDLFQDRTYEFPAHVISLMGSVHFACNSKHYCLHGPALLQCRAPYGVITAPRCRPACGVRDYPKQPLIVGGRESAIQEWPWQASLVLYNHVEGTTEFLCGATLIHDRWAVTAAHCVTDMDSHQVFSEEERRRLRLVYGQSTSEEARQEAANNGQHQGKYTIAQIIVHEDYQKRGSLDNDIALLQLDQPAEMGFSVGVACLPPSLVASDRLMQHGQEGHVTGWGRTEDEDLSHSLKEMTVTVVNTSTCVQHYEDLGYNKVVVTDSMFCTMSNSSREDSSTGDSGGPFVVFDETKGRWVLEGIVSWGAPEKHEDQAVTSLAHIKLGSGPALIPVCEGVACFSGYTRVGKFVEWMRNHTGLSADLACP